MNKGWSKFCKKQLNNLPVVVRTGLPTLIGVFVDLDTAGVDTAAETEGGDSAGADDVTADTGFTVAPKAVNPPTKPDPSADVLTALGAFIPVARRKEKQYQVFSRYLNLASCIYIKII